MIADDAVGADQLASNAVVDASVASGAAIALSKLASGSSAQIIVHSSGGVPTAVALSGDATISNTGALTLAANSVSQAQLDDDAVGADELASNAVVTASIVDNAVTLAKMAGITRGSIILGDSSGDPSLLAKGSAAQLLQSDGTDPSYVTISGDATVAAGGALTIANDAVEQAMIADDAVGADQLAANAVVTASIVDNAVTLAKMAGLTRGSIILGDSSGDPSALAKGSAAQFLQSDGTDPSYVTISGDATVAAGGALTIAAGAVEGSMLDDSMMIKDNAILATAHSAMAKASASDYWTLTLGSALGGAKTPISNSSVLIFINGQVPFLADSLTDLASSDGLGYFVDKSTGSYGTIYLGKDVLAGGKLTIWYMGE